jgi:sugar lactone lactonase YvrE
MTLLSAPETVWTVGAELGEGPVWSPRDGSIWFVDIKGPRIHRLGVADGGRRSWDAPEQVGFILPVEGGGWIAGLQSGPHLFEPESGIFTPLPAPQPHPAGNRLNDGYVDASGRLWFGTMADDESARSGGLYRLERDGLGRLVDGDYVIPNGPCSSPDGRTFYHTDTRDRTIYAFDMGPDGALSRKRPFVKIAREGANPDGSTVDSEGCVWVALFRGWGVERYSPGGELLDYVPMPCANLTKPAFGGEDLRTVFVTSAKLHLSPEQRDAQTSAGDLFSFRVDVPGLAPHEIRRGDWG